ncbi:MAG: PEGA domain-containing protein [Spirochaetia bacterium]
MSTIRATLGALLALGLAGVLLASCATSSGSTLGTVTVSEGSSPPPEKPPTEPPTSKQGLEVVSDPDRAEIWIDGDYKGLTPFIVTDIPQGWHRLILRKSGYREASSWVQFTSDYMLYQTTLVEIKGFLQIDVTPPDSIVTVGSSTLPAGLQQLPVGSYAVVVRAFGYADYKEYVTISENAVTNLSVALQPTPFQIGEISLPHRVINPDSPGILGNAEVAFSVTGPGTGHVEVYDPASQLVYGRDLPEFTTWNQTFRWDVHDNAGNALADGAYRLVVSGQGSDGESSQQETTLKVDRTLKIAPRSVWSGSSGLLYAPVAEVLPEGDFQASVLGAAYSDGAVFRAPVSLGIRMGIGSRLEVDAMGAIIPSSVALPFALSAAVRWNLLSPHSEVGLEAAVEAKASFQYDTSPTGGNVLLTDTFANFTGLDVAVPLQLVLGPVSVLGSAGLIGSLWTPYGSTSPSPVAWLYLRAGLMADIASVTAGVSATVRTQPLLSGIAAIGWPVPLQLGAEAHWLVPGSRILVSAILAGEFDSRSSYYFMGGGGLGFLY